MALSSVPSILLSLSLLCANLYGSVSANVLQRNVQTISNTVLPSVTTTGGVVLPTGVLGTCPSANGTRYDTPAGVYLVQCNLDYYGYNTPGNDGQVVANFQACLDMCAADGDCVTVAYWSSSKKCWMHTIITVPTPETGKSGLLEAWFLFDTVSRATPDILSLPGQSLPWKCLNQVC